MAIGTIIFYITESNLTYHYSDIEIGNSNSPTPPPYLTSRSYLLVKPSYCGDGYDHTAQPEIPKSAYFCKMRSGTCGETNQAT